MLEKDFLGLSVIALEAIFDYLPDIRDCTSLVMAVPALRDIYDSRMSKKDHEVDYNQWALQPIEFWAVAGPYIKKVRNLLNLSVLDFCPNLEEVDMCPLFSRIGDEGVGQISKVKNLKKLRSISIFENEFPVTLSEKLESLTLKSYYFPSDVTFRDPTNLTELTLIHCCLDRIDFLSLFPNLSVLKVFGYEKYTQSFIKVALAESLSLSNLQYFVFSYTHVEYYAGIVEFENFNSVPYVSLVDGIKEESYFKQIVISWKEGHPPRWLLFVGTANEADILVDILKTTEGPISSNKRLGAGFDTRNNRNNHQ